MYTSGVFFSIDHYVGTGAAASVVSHQPIAVYLELVRCTLLEEMDASLSLWLWGAGWAIGALIIGFIYFWRAEGRYGRGGRRLHHRWRSERRRVGKEGVGWVRARGWPI